MQTSPDTFLGFVDGLASALDDDAGSCERVVGALYKAGITDLVNGDPRKWVAEAA